MKKSMLNKTIWEEPRTDFSRSDKLREKSHRLIPGGCHTYAKGDDQYPVLSPGFIIRGKNGHVWDVDGNEYIEFGMGNRAVGLGHAFEPVLEAVRRELEFGANFGRPSPIEVECAELFLELVPGAEMVKFCKDGSDATTAALRLARGYTNRDLIAVCGDHPFFSINDWFIGTTAMHAGIPTAVRDLSLTFRYNDIESLRALFSQYPGQIAAVILEPAKYSDPEDRFLHRARELCRENGTVFILDEMITGFRWHAGGAQAYYDIVPDLSTFGKAMANGFSVSAIVGKRELMERGGLQHDRERVFLLSTTHGGETHALAAAMATMRTYRDEPVIETFNELGRDLTDGIRAVVNRRGLGEYVDVLGKPCCLVLVCKGPDGASSQSFRTLMLQETIRRGILMPSLVVSYTHTKEDIEKTIEAIDASLEVYARALTDGPETHLVGRPSKVVHRRFN